MAPATKGSAAGRGAGLLEWLSKNQDALQQADNLIGARRADAKQFGEHTDMALCDAVLSIVKKSVCHEGHCSESSSVLLLGEAHSGKTHVVEYCIKKIKEVSPSVVILRAYGKYYTSDVECVRHLASQVAGQTSVAPRANASFDAGMEWFKQVLTESFQHASAAVVVLDRFEHFCSRQRQTLLYNLFDIAEGVGVCLSIIGTSEQLSIAGKLEKRIKSRFSMRHLHPFMPSTMEDLVPVLMSKFRLGNDSGLKPAFIREFHGHVEAALRACGPEWEPFVGDMSPMWFLRKCLPLHAFLHDAAHKSQATEGGASASSAASRQGKRLLDQGLSDPKEPNPTKRSRGEEAGEVQKAPEEALQASLKVPPCRREQSSTGSAKQRLLLTSLTEADLIILLALFRLADRRVPPTLARALFEIQQLHKSAALVSDFSPDCYTISFERLVEMKLISVGATGCSEDTPRRYLPCKSTVLSMDAMVSDLERSTQKLNWSPLRSLPQPVQQWAARQRK